MVGALLCCFLLWNTVLVVSGCQGDTSPEMVTDIELAEKQFSLGIGNSYQLNVFHFPGEIAAPHYEWTSNNEDVVTVSGGLITGIAEGEALVIVSSPRLMLADTCRVVVREITIDNLTIEPSSVTIQSGESVTLTATVEPAYTEYIHFIWESLDEEVAIVEDGVVTGLRGGSALITVKTVFSEIVGTAVVTVERDLQKVSLEVTEPGTLERLLDTEIRITDLTLKGRLDARDLNIISRMEYLYFLDMEEVEIEAVYLQTGYFPANELLAENFYGMRIDRVLLPKNLSHIPARCFAYSSLSSIEISSSIEYIADGAFMGTTLLDEIDIPSGVTYLASSIFAESGVSVVNLPEGLTSVGSEIFRDCIRLTSMELPAGIREMGSGLFRGCTSLRHVTLPAEITHIGGDTFSGCVSLTTVDLPAGIQELGTGLFKGCTSLRMITLPMGVTVMDDEIFSGCVALTSLDIPSGVQELGDAVFKGCTGLRSLALPAGLLRIGDETFANCIFTTLTLPAGMEEMGSGVFKGCTSLTTLTLPSGVEVIGDELFSGCTALSSVALPADAVEMGSSVFRDCTSLRTVDLPAGLEEMGTAVFRGCTSLQTITLPAGITELGAEVFHGCTSLSAIHFKTSIPPTGMVASTFTEIDREACVLYVPTGSLEAYRANTVLNGFTQIVEE